MKYILQLSVIWLIIITITSCNVKKNLYTSSFQHHGSNVPYSHANGKADVHQTLTGKKQSVQAYRYTVISDLSELATASAKVNENYLTPATVKLPVQPISNASVGPAELKALVENCDVMVLLSGDEIRVKVLEIGLAEIKYHHCDSLENPQLSINKSEVFMIKYANGSRDVISTSSSAPVEAAPTSSTAPAVSHQAARTHGLAVASLVLGILSVLIFILGLPLAILALIFGYASYNKIKKNPGKFKGKGISIAGMILGGVSIIVSAIFMVLILGTRWH